MAAKKIETRAFLANLAMFRELSPDDLDRIAAGTVERRVAKGEVLFRRGDPCKGFHVVVYGQVKLAFTSPQGAEKVVDVVGPGQSFGEALMFTDRPYVLYAQALADALVLHVAKETVDAEIAREPRIARRMLAGLSGRLIGLIQDVEAYSLRSGTQRVIGYLLRDVDVAQGASEPLRVNLDVNKGVIASRLNLTPEHFSRILAELTHEGLIAVDGPTITILDPGKLRTHLA